MQYYIDADRYYIMNNPEERTYCENHFTKGGANHGY